jgi:hypothetical protein
LYSEYFVSSIGSILWAVHKLEKTTNKANPIELTNTNYEPCDFDTAPFLSRALPSSHFDIAVIAKLNPSLSFAPIYSLLS